MEYACSILDKTLLYYIAQLLALLCLGIIGIFMIKHGRGNSTRLTLMTIVLFIWLSIYFFASVVPFLSDYSARNILVVEGIYKNVNQQKTHSATSGVSPVTISCGGNIIKLTTAPWSKSMFVKGEYHVIAYYAPKSSILLYIEIIGDG